MIIAMLAVLVIGIALLLWAHAIERGRRLVCEIIPKVHHSHRTWKLRISSESISVKTLGKVAVSGSLATSVHAEQSVVNVGPIILAKGQRAEFDLEPPLNELLDKLGRPRQSDAAIALDVTIDIHYRVKNKKRRRRVRFIALCDHGGLVRVFAQPPPDYSALIVSVPV